MSPLTPTTRSRRGVAILAACGALALVSSACGAGPSPEVVNPRALATPPSVTLSYAGPQAQQVPVPAGATSATFVLVGGSGGNGSDSGGRGGYGAVVAGTVQLGANATLSVSVGQQGGHYGTNSGNNYAGWGAPSGGQGGTDTDSGASEGGGGGGGATTLVLNDTAVVTAGGGGGGGGGGEGGAGGDGGASGYPAHDGNQGHGDGGQGGQAGTESDGIGALGGNGGNGSDAPGGGGGGGAAGGQGGHGAGQSGGGGGAGTCTVNGQVTDWTISYATALGNGSAQITWKFST